MENLSVSPSRFDDVGIILNGNNCFVGLETPDGVEACTLDKPFVLNKKVLSRYDEACNYIKKILPVKMKIELPRGYRLTLTPDDLAVFFSQKCDMSAMRDYIEERKTRTEAETRRWLAERPWDTMPVSGAEAEAQNFVFDSDTGMISTDGCFNPATTIVLPSSIDGVRVCGIKEYAFVSYTYLETFIMPDSITCLEPYAFYDKVHLRNVNLSKNLERISEGAFSRCRALNSVIIPDLSLIHI